MSDEKALATAEAADLTPMRPSNMGDALRLAEVMCKGRLVPTHLQGSVADCLMVIEQAARWGLSPFAVAQCTSVVSGKLMYEGKLVAAVINARGDMAKRLAYEYSGAGDDRRVRTFGTIRGEAEPREVTVILRDVRTQNSMWRSQPDQQLAYSSARIWARRHAPELMLGIYGGDDDEVAGEQLAPAPVTGPSGPPVATAGTDHLPPREVIRGFGDEDEEQRLTAEYTEPVDIYDKETGEVIRQEPKLTDAQNKLIHVRLRQVRNQYDDARYRKDLLRTFGKEHTNQLSTREANKVLDGLNRRYEKIRPELEAQEREHEAARAREKAAAEVVYTSSGLPVNREPGEEG